MQTFLRADVPPPAFLRSELVAAAREAFARFYGSDTAKRDQTSLPRDRINLDEPTVRGALDLLFKRRCAFCETRTPTQPYRLRPPADATPYQDAAVGHLYYAWLSEAWENIYPICSGCIPKRPDRFPVTGKRVDLPSVNEVERYVQEGIGLWRGEINEKALLLDPCGQTTYVAHLHPTLSGFVYGRTKRGRATVENFQLNRPELVSGRAAALVAYLDVAMEGRSTAEVHGNPVASFKELEFGGIWYLYLRRIAKRARTAGITIPLSSAFINPLLPILEGTGGRNRLREIVGNLEIEDDRLKDVEGGSQRPRRKRPFSSASRIASASFRDFKALGDFELTIEPTTAMRESKRTRALLILGENAAGKSSILEGICLALCGDAERKLLDLTPERLIHDPEIAGSTGRTRPRSAKIEIVFTEGERTNLRIDNSRIKSDDLSPVPVFAYGAFRQYQSASVTRRSRSPIVTLFKTNIILPNPERWLLELDESSFKMVVRALRDILAVEGDFDVIERQQDRNRCGIVTRAASVASFTPLELASSGFRSVLAMACDLMAGLMRNAKSEALARASAVVLIDEVEAHLHPRWKMQIMRGLRNALPNVTFIATSHDPLCIRGMDDDEIVVLRGGAQIAGSAQTGGIEQLSGLPTGSRLTVGQILTSDYFGLLSTDGPEEEIEMARIADLLASEAAGESLSDADKAALRTFRTEISTALPIGTSETQRIVQAAVAAYLEQRKIVSAERLEALHAKTKSRILQALEAL